MTDASLNPRQRGSLVEALGSAVFHGGAALGDVPALLKRVLETGAWREFETPTHEIVTHARFESFITTPPTRGLGATPELIERIIQEDAEAILLYRDTVKTAQGTRTDLARNLDDNIIVVQQGTSKAYGMERLQRERPDLFEQVQSGQRSTHSAMIEAGFRRPTITVPITSMSSLAATLMRRLNHTQRAELVAQLQAIMDFTQNDDEMLGEGEED